MNILTLSGWGQPHDALSIIAHNAQHHDYAGNHSIENALKEIAEVAKNHDAIIGWSLGGQLALRAIDAGLMKPKKLILIGVPFQFVRVDDALGMPTDQFIKFRDNYQKNPARTLSKAWELVLLGDTEQQNMRAYFGDSEKALQKNWLHWLDILNGFSCKTINFANFPDTLIIHGKNDAVVYYAQSQEFLKSIPLSKHIAFDNAGHAPHWHDAETLKKHIHEFLYV